MKKTLIILHLLLATTLIANPTLSSSDIEILYKGSAGGTHAAYTLSKLSSKSDAIEFLQDLKEVHYQDGIALSPSDTGITLANLGHIETLERVYRAYSTEKNETRRAYIFTRISEKISSPALLAVIGDDIYKKEGEKVTILGDNMNIGYNIPFGNAYIIIKLVEGSHFFPPDSVAWAKSVRLRDKLGNPTVYLNEVRAFWAENSELIKAGEYSRVHPPSERTEVPTDQPTTVLPPTQPAANSTPDIGKLAAATIITPPPARQADTNHIKLVWWTAGIIATLITAALALRKKGLKNQR